MVTFHAIADSRAGNESGFSLIELIAVLIILGIAGALAGSGLIMALETYILDYQSVSLVQDTDFAMKRISSELRRQMIYKHYSSVKYNYCLQGVDENTDEWNFDYRWWYFIPPSEESDGAISTTATTSTYSFLIGGLGNYSAADEFLICQRYDGAPLNLSDKDHLKATVSVCLVTKNPSGSGNDLTFRTMVALRNNSVPNMPVPR